MLTLVLVFFVYRPNALRSRRRAQAALGHTCTPAVAKKKNETKRNLSPHQNPLSATQRITSIGAVFQEMTVLVQSGREGTRNFFRYLKSMYPILFTERCLLYL